MASFHTRLVRLAHAQPELRRHLVPLLRQAMFDRVGSKPDLEAQGLNKDTARDGRGAMLYFIDKAKNHSKFYEMVIVQEGGGYKLIRLWGALTDRGSPGRKDSATMTYENMNLAMGALKKIYREKTGKGYIDAYGPDHINPTDGLKLPMGQYPIGLDRQVGFGWGTQSVTKCIPALREVVQAVDTAREHLLSGSHANLVDVDLQRASDAVKKVMVVDDSMYDKLMDLFGKPFRRLQRSMGYVNEQDAKTLAAELYTARNYITKQLGYCD